MRFRSTGALYIVIAAVLVIVVFVGWHYGPQCPPETEMCGGENVLTFEVGPPEAWAHGGCPCSGIARIIAGLKSFQDSLILSKLTSWVMSEVVHGFFDRIYREAATLFSNIVSRITAFGGYLFGDKYVFVEQYIRGLIASVNQGMGGVPLYSVFASYVDLPKDNDAYIYLGKTRGAETMYQVAQEVIRRAESDNDAEFREAMKWFGEHSPYAPTSLQIQNKSPQTMRDDVVRYTRLLVGDPLELKDYMKRLDPLSGAVVLKESVRMNVRKRLAADIAAEAIADIKYAVDLEKTLKELETAGSSSSFTTVIKNLSRVAVLQAHINTKLLKQLAHQNLVMAELVAELGERSRQEVVDLAEHPMAD